MKKKPWVDPVKKRPAKDETLAVKGSFQEFTELMRKIVNKRDEPKLGASSRVPGAS